MPAWSSLFRSPKNIIYSNELARLDRKSTRLNSSHSQISYAVFCLKKKKCRSKAAANPTSRRSSFGVRTPTRPRHQPDATIHADHQAVLHTSSVSLGPLNDVIT